MAFKINTKLFEELLGIQQERQLAMKELSESLGVDVSFSDEEVMQFAMEEYQKEIDKQLGEEIEKWMKSAFSKN